MCKKYFAFLIALCIIASVQTLVSHETATLNYSVKSLRGRAIDDRIYLHPGMAHITPKGLVVQLNGESLSVPTIESDEHGVFIRMQYVAGMVRPGDWCCSTCWHWNSSNRASCRICGSDRDD